MIKIYFDFVLGFIWLSLFELIGGFLIEKIFNTVFWSYKKMKYNLGNYISLETSLIWGFSSMLIIYVKKYIDKIIKKIPKYVTLTLITLFLFDVIFVVIFKIFF